MTGREQAYEASADSGWGMLSTLRGAARFLDEKIGLSWIGLALSLTIIAVAAVVLFHMLRDIDVDDVFDAIEAVPYRSIGLAGLFVAAGYCTLTFYDLFALRQIGRGDVPYRVAALTGFTSYSVGHNIGASMLTAGAVRYRIYSGYGLDAVDVAKICFLAGLTFWLGNATMLGVGILCAPDAAGAVERGIVNNINAVFHSADAASAIDQVPPDVNRALAGFVLIVLAAYVTWVWRQPRSIGRGHWRVRLPSGPSTLLQIGIGMVDLTCCALAMYMLVPTEPNVGLVTVSVIFVSATLLGFASHSPGGLGVFDAAMLGALGQFESEDLLAGLLLFRLLYYIVPFTLTLAILGTREVWINVVGARVPRPVAIPASEQSGKPEVANKTEVH